MILESHHNPNRPMLVRGQMVREVITASPATSLGDALELMRARRIRHLPVVEGERLVGVVSDRDLQTATGDPATAVGEIMREDVLTVTPDTPIEEAARLMAQQRVGCLPVLENAKLAGILTASDILKGFVELFGVNKPSSRLEVRLPNRPGELARVVRLIGIDERLNITGMVVPPVAAQDAVAVIRIQTLDPRAVIEGLQSLGYEVGWPALDLEPAPGAPQA